MPIEANVPLAPRTTLGVGGPARRFARVASIDELRWVLADADRAGDRVLVLGGGSNLVVSDAGWDGLVVQLGTTRIEQRGAELDADGGVVWDELVARSVEAGLAGLECLAGIPGLVGATPMQNVGAYGQEVSDTITAVRALDRETGELVTFAPAECAFAYRDSRFKGHARWIITGVTFGLTASAQSRPVRYAELARALGIAAGDSAPLPEVRRMVIELRRGKGMVVDAGDPESRSAGSFFVNPIVDATALAALEARLGPGVVMPRFPAPDGLTKLAAGWLIERAGFAKGYTVGRVGISRKHALALVNRGGATAAEVMALAREIQDGVRDRLGVELSPEPVRV